MAVCPLDYYKGLPMTTELSTLLPVYYFLIAVGEKTQLNLNRANNPSKLTNGKMKSENIPCCSPLMPASRYLQTLWMRLGIVICCALILSKRISCCPAVCHRASCQISSGSNHVTSWPVNKKRVSRFNALTCIITLESRNETLERD